MEVIKNKNKVEKENKRRRQLEIKSIKDSATFKAKVLKELSYLDEILDEDEDAKIEIEISERDMSLFSKLVYEPEMTIYKVSQSDKKVNSFIISKKFISY